MMSLKYLRPTIKTEALVWNWYAWGYLIPPITAGCNIVERHLKIMQSYIQNPLVHAQVVKDPKMLGGPFLDLGGKRVEEIKQLIIDTKEICSSLISLNDSYKELDSILQIEAVGDSLDNIYLRIPDALKGLVEIVYDLNNHPSIRIIEPLVYSKYYVESVKGQRVALSDTISDDRKFVLSTPRLDQDNEVYLNLPFHDPRIDALSKMKYEPREVTEINDLFHIPESKHSLFKSFFTSAPPNLPVERKYSGDGVRLRYFGHACILVETKSVSILFDPVIGYPIKTEEAQKVPRYTLEDLPDNIDYVVLTHNHQDHILFETLLQLRHKVKNIVFPASQIGSLGDPSIKLILKYIGFSCNLIELKEMEEVILPAGEGKITGLPFFGEHSDLNIQSKMAYSLKLKGKHFLFAADSNNLDPTLYDHIFAYVGEVDMLFLGMECKGAPLTWLYGSLLTIPLNRSYDNNRSLSGSNFEKAWLIAQKSKCKEAYIYAMGQEPWLRYIMALEYKEDSPQIVESNKFIAACVANGIKAERPYGRKEWMIE